jgi:hypothetical protein
METPDYRVRWLHGIISAGVALWLFFIVCDFVLRTPYFFWNAARLMPSFALARGIDYYVLLPRGGPLYSTLYPPMVAIVYLPSTIFRTPNGSVLVGAAITVLLCFSAVALLHFTPFKSGRGAANGWAFLTACLLICFQEPLRYSCFNIHADGPGLAFGAFACAALYAGFVEKWHMALPVSAVCAILSVFCKQTFLPVPIMLLVWILAVQGRKKAARRYLLYLVAAWAFATAAAILAWGLWPLYHCLIWVPAHQPWKGPRIWALIQSAMQFIHLSFPILVALLACMIYSLGSGSLRDGRWRALLTNRCVPPLLVGIALLPSSILGAAKVGGDVNSFSFALFFLTCGVTLAIADLWYGASADSTRQLAMTVLVAIALSLGAYETRSVLDIPSAVSGLSHTDQEVAFAYLERHPGQAYFPSFPLAHLDAEGQFRHFESGIVDRWLAGETVSDTEFWAYIPRDPRVIAFGPTGDPGPDQKGYDLMRNLQAYSRTVNDPELPGWLVYEKQPK